LFSSILAILYIQKFVSLLRMPQSHIIRCQELEEFAVKSIVIWHDAFRWFSDIGYHWIMSDKAVSISSIWSDLVSSTWDGTTCFYLTIIQLMYVQSIPKTHLQVQKILQQGVHQKRCPADVRRTSQDLPSQRHLLA